MGVVQLSRPFWVLAKKCGTTKGLLPLLSTASEATLFVPTHQISSQYHQLTGRLTTKRHIPWPPTIESPSWLRLLLLTKPHLPQNQSTRSYANISTRSSTRILSDGKPPIVTWNFLVAYSRRAAALRVTRSSQIDSWNKLHCRRVLHGSGSDRSGWLFHALNQEQGPSNTRSFEVDIYSNGVPQSLFPVFGRRILANICYYSAGLPFYCNFSFVRGFSPHLLFFNRRADQPCILPNVGVIWSSILRREFYDRRKILLSFVEEMSIFKMNIDPLYVVVLISMAQKTKRYSFTISSKVCPHSPRNHCIPC